MINWLANPARFMRLSAKVVPWCAWAAVLVLAVGLFWSLAVAPPDYQQGDTMRIMYVHVPAAWMALSIYLFVAVASAVALVWRHPLAEVAARAAAPIGAAFTFVCLTTGSLWGRPMWGAWWVWDARLTSVLILFFLYLGYIALANAFDDPSRGGRAAAVLALVGVVNLPIVKFSVDWWNTLHQPASVHADRRTQDRHLDARPAVDHGFGLRAAVCRAADRAYENRAERAQSDGAAAQCRCCARCACRARAGRFGRYRNALIRVP